MRGGNDQARLIENHGPRSAPPARRYTDEIMDLITSLKAAIDISKSILEIKSTTEIQDKVTKLQSALMEAQNSAVAATTAQLELQEKVRTLEEQLRAANEWGDQESRYSLVSPWKGPGQVYALKRLASEGETPHFLCSNCFHNKRKVILNPSKKDGWILMACPSCRATIHTGYRGIGPSQYAE